MHPQSPESTAAVSDPKHDDGDETESVTSDLSTDEYFGSLDSDFSETISNIHSLGSLTSFHTLPNPPPGGVSIQGVGNIDMPLGERQARQIITQASRRDCSESDDYLWELDSTQFILDDAVWPNIIQGLSEKVTRDLGITTAVKAQPEKMILIEKGSAYSEEDLSTREIIGKLGDLAIFLPSIHQGGEKIYKYRGEEKVVFAPNQAAQSFASWYTCINPLPHKSGYLWILIYSLGIDEAHANPYTPLLRVHEAKLKLPRLEMRPLRHTLRRWIEKDVESRGQQAIYYPLDYEYKGEGFCKRMLLGSDNIRVQLLDELFRELPFEIFLARIKKARNEGSNDQDGDIDLDQDPSRYIVSIVDLDGYEVTKSHSISRADADRCLKDPSKKEASYYMYGYSYNGLRSQATSSGFVAAAVIIPQDSILPFFFGRDEHGRPHSADHAPSLLGRYARACLHQPLFSTVIILEEICALILDDATEESRSLTKPLVQGNDICDTLRALLMVGYLPYFNKLIATHEGHLPTSFFHRVRRWLDDGFNTQFEEVEIGLTNAIHAYSQPSQQIRAVRAIADAHDNGLRRRVAEIPDCVLHWARQVLKTCIDACGSKKLMKQDGQALAQSCLYFDDPFVVLSQVKEKIDPGRQPAAFLGFINKVYNYGRHNYVPEEKSLSFYRDAANAFIASTAFVQMRGTDGHQCRIESDCTSDEEDDISYIQEDDYWEGVGYHHLMVHYHRPGDDDDDKMSYGCYKSSDGEEQSLERGAPAELEQRGVHYKSFCTLLNETIIWSDEKETIFEKLVSRVVDIAPQIRRPEFHTLWLPALNYFAKVMTIIIREKPQDYRSPLFMKFFSAIINAYLDNCVGRYPKRPSLSRRGVSCSCPDCKGLNVFLDNRLLKFGRFKADKDRCQHLVMEMAVARIDFDSKIQEVDSSHTLIVTKTQKHLAHKRGLWKRRRQIASKKLAKFGQEKLAALLGHEWMTFFSMTHLGGVGYNDLEIRTLLKMKRERDTDTANSEGVGIFGNDNLLLRRRHIFW
ncbi:hypothetical protein V8C37DRAFT_419593 [Trichoderma ceciliae]